MRLEEAIAFAAGDFRGLLLTIQPDGRPHASNVSYATFDGAFHVSVTAGRVKHRNLERDPRAGLYVGLGDFHRWVVLEGKVTFADIPTHPDDEGAVLLRKVYETIAGPHPDWDEFDQVMIEDRRRVISLHPERAYGMLP